MAVIRAKRLWLVELPAAAAGDPNADPTIPGTPELQAASVVYRVPVGKRAIVRHISAIIPSTGGATTQPTVTAYVRPGGVGDIAPAVFWAWFRTDTVTGHTVWTYSAYWNGQLVLHANDTLEMAHLAITPLSTQGSGHELNELVA